jgi:hypothetical protein
LDEAISTYIDTVHALNCFGHILVWDDKAKTRRPGCAFVLGPRVQTSPANKIAPNTTVTPDLMAVATSAYGIVAEAKLSFRGSVRDRQDDLNQLMKYDEDLLGWPTPTQRVEKSDLALLVHYSRKGDSRDILEAAKNGGHFRTARSFAAVCFTRLTQTQQEYMALEHFWGAFSDGGIQKRLRPLLVPLEAVLPFCPAKMYDAPPPLPLLIQLAWDHVFNRLVPEEAFQSGKRALEINCSVQEVRDWLAEACGPPRAYPRQPEIPQLDWVKEMFDFLVRAKLAVRAKGCADQYTVLYRRKKLAFFVEKYARSRSKKSAGMRRRGSGQRAPRDHPELPLG